MGFSILTLVVSCTFNEAVVGTCEDVAEQLQDEWEDDVQSVDVCCWRESTATNEGA